jgi:hypothetical protein
MRELLGAEEVNKYIEVIASGGHRKLLIDISFIETVYEQHKSGIGLNCIVTLMDGKEWMLLTDYKEVKNKISQLTEVK